MLVVKKTLLAFVIVFSALSALALNLIYMPTLETMKVERLVWEIKGGFAGFSEILVLESDGAVLYTSKLGDLSISVSLDEVEKIFTSLTSNGFFKLNDSYPAREGAADYFIYTLTIYTSLGSKTVKWVDTAFSAEPIPTILQRFTENCTPLIQKLRSELANRKCAEAAITFIINTPTFKFDGIPESIQILSARKIEDQPAHYIVELAFKCRQAGYGDRAGKEVAQVITLHTAEIHIAEGSVIAAVIDGLWDELNQRPI